MELKTILKHTQDGIRSELKKAVKLEGERLESFQKVFNTPELSDIFFTKYNLVITDADALDALKPFLKEENLVMSITIKSFNCFLWVYEITNDALFDQFLNDYEEE